MNKENLLRHAKSESSRLLKKMGAEGMPSPEAVDDCTHGFVNYFPLKILAPVDPYRSLKIAAQCNDGRTMDLYLHSPLCYSKCTFCSYASTPYSQKIADEYFTALKRDIVVSGNLYHRNTISSVYFGGGTSTIWPVEYLEKLFSLVDENFYLLNHANICVEANPHVFTESKKTNDGKFEKLAELGVGRISIGIQTFNGDLLKKVGRGYYDKEDIVYSLDVAKQLFNEVNMDLMYSLPGQTLEGVLSDLDEVEKLSAKGLMPDQITWYQTRVSPHCRISGDFTKNFSSIDALTSRILIANGLKEIGFTQAYENRFSLDGKIDEFKKNRGQGNSLGLGVSAFSHFTYKSDSPFLEWITRNNVSIKGYLKTMSSAEEPPLPIATARKFSRDEMIISHFINRLIQGSDLDEAVFNKVRFHTTLMGHRSPFSFESPANSLHFASVIGQLEQFGFLEVKRKKGRINSINLTQDGQYLSTEIAQFMYSPLTQFRIEGNRVMTRLLEITTFINRFFPH